MDIQEHTKGVMRTVKRLDSFLMDNLHLTLGMVTEAGELADIFKKYIAYNKPIDWTNVEEELGDELFYIFAFCYVNNLDFQKICEQNLSKLQVRYDKEFTEKEANNRNLSEERKRLELLGYKQK
jgi:NTP pyrophosphatase (non-canonical NTP hydrolase)